MPTFCKPLDGVGGKKMPGDRVLQQRYARCCVLRVPSSPNPLPGMSLLKIEKAMIEGRDISVIEARISVLAGSA